MELLHTQTVFLAALKYLLFYVDSHLIDNLTDSLFYSYNEAVRPQCDTNDTTTVDLYMSLRQILDIDEPQQTIKLNAWIRMTWIDCRLLWDPTKFGNISGFVVPYNTVWVPDITLYDNAEPVLSGLKDYRANLNRRGELSYNFPSLITSVCALDIRYFPFDFQICSLTLGSWAYNGFAVNFTFKAEKIEISSYLENSEWHLRKAYISRNSPLYDGIPYPNIEFHIELKRKPLFYIVNVVFPCLLITFVAVLGFFLPPDSGEKISLQVTVLLSLAVFQLVILDMIPASGDSFPFIAVYFTLSMLIVAVSCMLTVVVLRVHFKGKYGIQLNERIRKKVLIPLTKITFIDLKKYALQDEPSSMTDKPMKTPEHKSSMKPNLQNTQCFQTLEHGVSMTPDLQNGQFFQTLEHGGSMKPDLQNGQRFQNEQDIVAYLDGILYHIGRINKFMKLTSEHREIEKWWNVFSQAFDRLFLFIYLLCTVGIALILTVPSVLQQTEE